MTISGKDRYLIMQKLARGADMKVCTYLILRRHSIGFDGLDVSDVPMHCVAQYGHHR